MTQTALIPRTARIKFKKCAAASSDTPNGSSDINLFCGVVTPSHLTDPFLAIDAGAYPKVAALALWYDKYRVSSVWVGFDLYSKADVEDALQIFSYWSDSATPRHVETQGYHSLCNIPRIKFKRVISPKNIGGTSITRIFRRLSIKNLFPNWSHDKADFVGLLAGTAPSNLPHLHVGVVNMANQLLIADLTAFRYTCGATATLFRRDEVAET